MPYPRWLLKPLPNQEEMHRMEWALRGLNTVCKSAACPNISECFANKHLTFLILGNICTRNCAFCAVTHGIPLPVDEEEVNLIVSATLNLKLTHVVITSVTRDDLVDGGAAHYASMIKALRQETTASIEVLIPDFKGKSGALRQVVGATPQVIGHNLETVKRLQKSIRPHADYERSLSVLSQIKQLNGHVLTKSGLMLGLGENDDEILETMQDIRMTGCDMLTLGQYRQPGYKQADVKRFIMEEGFNFFHDQGLAMGFRKVLAGSYVRSSFRAGEIRALLEEQGAI